MKDGTYQYSIEMSVPMGRRNGKLEITIQDNQMTGFLTMFTDTQPINRGVCSGHGISFTGEMHNLMGVIPYIAEGTITLSQLKLVFHTRNGDYHATGRQTISDQRRITRI